MPRSWHWCSRPYKFVCWCLESHSPAERLFPSGSWFQLTMILLSSSPILHPPRGPRGAPGPGVQSWCGLELHSQTPSLRKHPCSLLLPFLNDLVSVSLFPTPTPPSWCLFSPEGISKATKQVNSPSSLKVVLLKSFRVEAELCDERRTPVREVRAGVDGVGDGLQGQLLHGACSSALRGEIW